MITWLASTRPCEPFVGLNALALFQREMTTLANTLVTSFARDFTQILALVGTSHAITILAIANLTLIRGPGKAATKVAIMPTAIASLGIAEMAMTSGGD